MYFDAGALSNAGRDSARRGHTSALSPERGCPQPQQHRPRNTAQVFGDPPPCGRAAAGDSRAPAELKATDAFQAGKAELVQTAHELKS